MYLCIYPGAMLSTYKREEGKDLYGSNPQITAKINQQGWHRQKWGKYDSWFGINSELNSHCSKETAGPIPRLPENVPGESAAAFCNQWLKHWAHSECIEYVSVKVWGKKIIFFTKLHLWSESEGDRKIGSNGNFSFFCSPYPFELPQNTWKESPVLYIYINHSFSPSLNPARKGIRSKWTSRRHFQPTSYAYLTQIWSCAPREAFWRWCQVPEEEAHGLQRGNWKVETGTGTEEPRGG